jgi:hypothetical protein
MPSAADRNVGIDMNQQPNTQITESSFPMGLVLVPMVVGSLVWLCVLVSRTGGF